MPGQPINDVGSYRHRIVIEHPRTDLQADNGQVNPDNQWATFASRWADITPLTSREYVYVNQVSAQFAYKIEFRYLPGLTAQMRIRWGSRIFEISKPPEDVEMIKRKHSVEAVESGV